MIAVGISEFTFGYAFLFEQTQSGLPIVCQLAQTDQNQHISGKVGRAKRPTKTYITQLSYAVVKGLF
jgi:hypothetical protein